MGLYGRISPKTLRNDFEKTYLYSSSATMKKSTP